MEAIANVAKQNYGFMETLKEHIALGLDGGSNGEEKLDLELRITEIDAEIDSMINSVSAETIESFDEGKVEELIKEKSGLQQQLALFDDSNRKQERQARLDGLFKILEGIKNRPLDYDNEIVRRIIECVVVESKEKIKVIFAGGLMIDQPIDNTGEILQERHFYEMT